MLAATCLFIAICFAGPITWGHGLILLAALTAMLWYAMRMARRTLGGDLDAGIELEEAEPGMPGWKLGLFLVAGLGGLPLGADILVSGAIDLAAVAGVSETVIGLTLVAVGTSLPELATTVMAAIRRQADVAMGNVIGSNMFNLLAIIGIASFFGDPGGAGIPAQVRSVGDAGRVAASAALRAVALEPDPALGRVVDRALHRLCGVADLKGAGNGRTGPGHRRGAAPGPGDGGGAGPGRRRGGGPLCRLGRRRGRTGGRDPSPRAGGPTRCRPTC
jgi:hypothetical protein